jgi:Protein of unknown function (DUF2380)
MRKFIFATLVAVSLSPLPHEARSADAPVPAAVFDFEWIDTSLEGGMNGLRADEQERLRMLGERLRRELAESGRFELVDIAPNAEQARHSNLQACGGCDARMARELGAKLAITGTVQKVSNLILNINIYTRDAATGRLLAVSSADMRGNTEESWFRTLDWIVKNRLLADELKQ